MSQRPSTHVPAVRVETEKTLGITQRSAAINFAWTGDIRKRYTDFLVNEIRKDGTVLHLRDFEEDVVPSQAMVDRKVSVTNPSKADNKSENKPDNKPKVLPISEEDRKAVVDLLGESVAQKLIELDESVQAKKPLAPNERSVAFDSVTDRSKRGTIHQEIRRIFRSRFETVADANGIITATASKWALNSRASRQNSGGRRENNNRHRDQAREFAEAGGEYLHFTLYKENKDTMDAVNTIARLLKIKASNFGFAGTKDRRAGTVQRISVYRQKASNLIWLNTRIPNVKVGDFSYSKEPLQLGQHGGNEFVITLKNCQPLSGDNCSLIQRMKMIQQAVECGLAYLKHHGYINYYGLQRFGTYTIGTHMLGMKILKGDYEGFIDDVLHVDEDLLKEVLSTQPQTYGTGKDQQNSRDDHNRARGITAWKTTKKADKALEFLPKRFSSEIAIIRHLGKNPKDFTGAVLSITRGMRMMYVHAYQSYVWNFVATRRWSKYGAKVIEGDLVLVTGSRRRDRADDDEFNPYDDNDDDNIYAQAHALTAADVASGKYTIFDVVLPTPGYDVSYPRNEIGEYYVEFMGRPENGSLSPFDMRRKQREFSLSGNYRPLIGRLIGNPQYAVRAYRDDTEQMYPTDLDYALHKKHAERLAKNAADTVNKPAPKPTIDPAVRSWAHFAQNPATYDSAMDASSRRRKAEGEPSTIEAPATNETWVQTTIDGNAKRVKIARHHQQIGNQTESGTPAAEVPTTDLVMHVDKPEGDATQESSSIDKDAPLTDNTQNASPSQIIRDGPFPMIPLSEGAVPKTGIRGVSDNYYAETGKVPYFGLPQQLKISCHSGSTNIQNSTTEAADNQAGDAIADSSTSEVTAHGADKMDWYGTNLPKVPNPSTSTTDDQAKGDNLALVNVGDTEVINGVYVPKLRDASDNPLSSVDAGIEEGIIDPLADKIAVILKFQLKASNYATIVLRELMGTTVEELSH